MKNFITRTITGILFVAIMVTGICLRGDAMILLFALITGLTLWEFTGLVNEHVADTTVNRFITTAAGVYLFLAFAGYCTGIVPPSAFIPYLLTLIYLFISELYLKQKNPIQDWAYTMLSQLYIALPFSMINVLSFQADPLTGQIAYHWLLPMSVFIFLWANDTGAYCAGSKWLGLGLVVVFFGTWGDLVESLFKRTLGIKDSGNILPGHGGMLDRFDSSLMAIPAAVIYLYTLQFLG